MARIGRRSLMTLVGAAGATGAMGIAAAWVARAATPIKFTLPWLPLGPYSFTFVAKAMGFWEKRGLDVTIDRGFGSGRVCVPVDQGQYDFGLIDLAVMMTCAGRGLDLVAVAGIWPVSPVGIFSMEEYNILKPEKSVAVHLESVKEFKGGSVTNEKVIEYGQACGTAQGMVPAFKQHGLGYMEPSLVEQTAQSVVTYMGVTTLPKTASMFTNKFVGTIRLTDSEWKSTEVRSRKYLPARV